jgi:hypothetical protein
MRSANLRYALSDSVLTVGSSVEKGTEDAAVKLSRIVNGAILGRWRAPILRAPE